MAKLIRLLLDHHSVPEGYMDRYVPLFDKRLEDMEQGRKITLDTFLDIMTQLRCDVIVVPRGHIDSTTYYDLSEFPDINGNVMPMPDRLDMKARGCGKIKTKGQKKK